MTRAFITVISLTGCAMPPPQVLYHTANGAALVCDVIAGVIKHCQEAPKQ